MKIELNRISKIFGPDPIKAVDMIEAGRDKAEVLQETGHTVALFDVSLTIEPASIYVVMGLSGSGKSTLLRVVNRLIDPTSGDVVINDESVLTLSDRELTDFRRQHLAMVFQKFALLPHRTVLDNAAYGLEIQGLAKSERRLRADEWLKQVGLEGYEQVYPSELSGGMQQRVGLARALATDTDVLLMDEPFSALDPLIRRDMQDLLLSLQSTLKKTIVFISHDLDEALRLGDRIAILKDGEIAQEGTPESIVLNPQTDYVRSFVRDVNRAKILQARHVMEQPAVVIADTARPFSVLRRCRDADQSFAYVTDSAGRPKGVVTVEACRSVAGGTTDGIAGLIQTVPMVLETATLEDVAPQTLEIPFPVPVVERDGTGAARQLLGVVSREAVLGALSASV